jgi:hypothetical protein
VRDVVGLSNNAIMGMTGVPHEEKSRLVRLRECLSNTQMPEELFKELLTRRLPIHNTFIHFRFVSDEPDGGVHPFQWFTSPGKMESGQFRIRDSCREAMCDAENTWSCGGSTSPGPQSANLYSKDAKANMPEDVDTPASCGPETSIAAGGRVSPAAGSDKSHATDSNTEEATEDTDSTVCQLQEFIARNKLDGRSAQRLMACKREVQQAVVAGGDLHGFDARNPPSAISGRIRDAQFKRSGIIGRV